MTVSRRALLGGLALWSAQPRLARGAEHAVPPASGSGLRALDAPGITLACNESGEIVAVRLGSEPREYACRARTLLADCVVLDSAALAPDSAGQLRFEHRWLHPAGGDECTVIERFSPTGNSIRWELEILGQGSPWSTAIASQLQWSDTVGGRFWTAWDHSPGPATPWRDPLRSAPFADLDLRYGGHVADADAFSLPIVSILHPSADQALSLVQSPESLLLECRLRTSASGNVMLQRHDLRISRTTPIHLAMDLVPHPADWRGGLAWMAQRYPHFFDPPNPRAYQLDGCGAYSAYQGVLDRDRMRRMAFSTNWNAHFDFPYQGLMMPPVLRNQSWRSWYGRRSSYASMRRYDRRMRRDGFHVLEYFVLTECGNYIRKAPEPRSAHRAADQWRDANDFVHYAIPDAVLRTRTGEIQYSNWFENVVVDPAEPAWRESLLAQARRLIDELPECDGICIDRMDWLTSYNTARDDGSSWVDGQPARSLLNSWKQTGAEVAAIVHAAGKCVYANPLVRRLDTLRFVDGLFDEYGDDPGMLNLCALLAVRKPAIGWTRDTAQLQADPDALLQRHLHLGVFPMAPYPRADHSIAADGWAERQFLDYGPLLAAIRGKRWVLRSHAIEAEGQAASVNLFEVAGGHAAPITFATSPTVSLRIRGLVPGNPPRLEALHPGIVAPLPLCGHWQEDVLCVQVPVRRRCALLKIYPD